MEAQFEVTSETHPRFFTSLAQSDADIREAQRLRYRVFAGELGARLPGVGHEIDRDAFDPHCRHLVVRERHADRVIGTYRILDGTQAEAVGGFYAEKEFDLPLLRTLRPRVVEIGRACVDPEYRNGAVLWQLWAALTRYIVSRRYDYVIGCASITLNEGAHGAAGVCHRITQDHLSPPQWRARPLRRFPLEDFDFTREAAVPPLIAGYLRLGAYACGDPAWDTEFNTADVLLWLPVREMNPHYTSRLLRES